MGGGAATASAERSISFDSDLDPFPTPEATVGAPTVTAKSDVRPPIPEVSVNQPAPSAHEIAEKNAKLLNELGGVNVDCQQNEITIENRE